jgi:hypothetical protein
MEEVTVTKQTIPKSAVDMLQKIEAIEKEVKDLKLSILKKLAPTGKKAVSLKGILRGVEVTDEDIHSAKKSLYSKIGL